MIAGLLPTAANKPITAGLGIPFIQVLPPVTLPRSAAGGTPTKARAISVALPGGLPGDSRPQFVLPAGSTETCALPRKEPESSGYPILRDCNLRTFAFPLSQYISNPPVYIHDFINYPL